MKNKLYYSFTEHKEKFPNDEACINWIKSRKWENGVPQCPSCNNNTMNYYISSRKTYKCSKCSKFFSPLAGTIFSKAKVPIVKFFDLMYFFTQCKSISSVQAAKYIGVPQQTAWAMLQKLRVALKDINNQVLLDGIVEIDELYINPKGDKNTRSSFAMKEFEEFEDYTLSQILGEDINEKKPKGRPKGANQEVALEYKRKKRLADKTEVYAKNYFTLLGMQERGGNVILKLLGSSDRSARMTRVVPTIVQHVSLDATIYTDEAPIYKKLKMLFHDHKDVNHSKWKFVKDDVHTNTIECCWQKLKLMLRSTHVHVSFGHVEKYLNEYTFRWNNRNASGAELFEKFLPFVVQEKKKMEFTVDKHIIWKEAA